MNKYEKYMHRCLQLAAQGAGDVAPNPMVGAVLIHGDRIIGEGFHQKYGGPHAEVNCINSVSHADKAIVAQSTLCVSLEPCAHFGKTPPCSDLIIQNKIPRVIIGCRDPFKLVNAKGIEKLKAAGTEVEAGVLEKECKYLNRRFFVFNTAHRPYIILKWAETADKNIAYPGNERLYISNEYTNRLVHKWRSEETSVLVGTNTALMDNPELTTRLWPGPSPVRLIVDMELKLPLSLKLFNEQQQTIVFNSRKQDEQKNVLYYRVTEDVSLVHQIMNALYQLKIQSVLVEGGAKLVQTFIDEGLWDEARIISNTGLAIGNGLPAPQLLHACKTEEQIIFSDKVEIFKPAENDQQLL